MKKRLIITLITSLVITANAYAEYSFVDSSDFTGDAFFTPPSMERSNQSKTKSERKATTPPIKKARLLTKKKLKELHEKKYEMAPMAEEKSIYAAGTETSEFASKDIKEDFSEDMMPDGFDADEESISNQKKHFWSRKENSKKAEQIEEDTESIILDCENMDYDTDTYLVKATGDVNVEFVKQGTVIKADIITFDRMNNTIKAEGNVRILKNGQTITGDYIFVDMNEENALIENPLTKSATIEIKAKRGYVYGDKIVQEEGSIKVDESYPIDFRSQGRGPRLERMLTPKNQTLTADMEKGIIKLEVKDIQIKQKGDLEVIALKRASLKKGNKKIIKVPAVKVYTNKNHDYADTNSWEIGSIRGLGMYVGPGFVFELPKGSILKAMPILNYKSGIGVGGIGRFHSGTNFTQVAYGSAADKFLIRGKQELDDNLYLQYAMNDYMNDWFLGRRRPKYGASIVYDKTYSSDDFLLKNHRSSYSHRFDMGYFHDIDHDKHFKKLNGGNMGTTRFRYMAEASQNLFNYENEEKLKAFGFDVVSQLSAGLYGTGDTQIIGRIGPRLHTQYKRWMQDVGYFLSSYSDNSPTPVYDAYRYGESNLYLREYFRICRFLTLSWFASINLSNDSPNGKDFQENSFYVSFGPDDVKFNIGYDFIRENTYFTIQLMMDAKGTEISYDKLEIKQEKKAQKEESLEDKDENSFQNSNKAPVLQRAVVEDIKTVEDVL